MQGCEHMRGGISKPTTAFTIAIVSTSAASDAIPLSPSRPLGVHLTTERTKFAVLL